MKKAALLILTLALALSLTACSKKKKPDFKNASSSSDLNLTNEELEKLAAEDKRILDNNAAYLDGWISSLKQEPKYVLSLMGDVDKASRLILDKLAS